MRNKLIPAMIAVLLLFMFTGCLSQSAPSRSTASSASITAAPTAEKNTVIIINFAFDPTPLTINKGDTVTWVNQDSSSHLIKFTDFESASFGKGGNYKHIFNESGSFDYICGIHISMTGRIIVN